jgi:hypothetical protein
MSVKKAGLLSTTGVLGGCQMFPTAPSTTHSVVNSISDVERITAIENLTILSGIGGLCLLSGMILLTISRGILGWRPIIGGVSLIILNYVISQYASWIFLPLIGATGAISLVWGYKNIRKILEIRKEKKNGNLK